MPSHSSSASPWDGSPRRIAPLFASETDAATRAPTCLPTSLRARLRFTAMLGSAFLLMVPFGLGMGIDSLVRPGRRTILRWYRRWGGGTAACGGIRVHVDERAELDPAQPVVFVANHQVAIDIPVMMRTLPLPFAFVAKSTVRALPVLGFFAQRTGSVFVDRSNPRRSLADLGRAAELLRNGRSILFFAEGTRSFAPVVGPLHSGAFRLAITTQAPIVPVTLRNTYRLADERAFASHPGIAQVVVGSPIQTQGLTRRHIPMLMETVATIIRGELTAEHDRWAASQHPQDTF